MGANNDTSRTIKNAEKMSKLLHSYEKSKYSELKIQNIPKKCQSHSKKRYFNRNKRINSTVPNKTYSKDLTINKNNLLIKKENFELLKNKNLANSTITEEETIIDLGVVEYANSIDFIKNTPKNSEKYKILNDNNSKKSNQKENFALNKNNLKCINSNNYNDNKKFIKQKIQNNTPYNKDTTKKIYSNHILNRDSISSNISKNNSNKISSKNTNINHHYNTNDQSLLKKDKNACYTEHKKINSKSKKNNYKIINKCPSCSNENKIINELSKNKIKQEKEIKFLKLKVKNLYSIIEDNKTQKEIEIKKRDELISELQNEKLKNENRISLLKNQLKNEILIENNLGMRSSRNVTSQKLEPINGGLYTDENGSNTARLNLLYHPELHRNNNNFNEFKRHSNYFSTEENNNFNNFNCNSNSNSNINILYKKKFGKEIKNLKCVYHNSKNNFSSDINMFPNCKRPSSIENIPNKNENQDKSLSSKNNNIYYKLSNKHKIIRFKNKHSFFRISASPIINKKYIYTSWNTNRNSLREKIDKSSNSRILNENCTKVEENLNVIHIPKNTEQTKNINQNKSDQNIIVLNKNIEKFELIKEPDNKEQTLNLDLSSSFSNITKKAKETQFLDDDTTLINWPLISDNKNKNNNIYKSPNLNKYFEYEKSSSINNNDNENNIVRNKIIINSLPPHRLIKYNTTTTSRVNILQNIWKINFIVFNEKLELFVNKNILLSKAIHKLIDKLKGEKIFELENIFDKYIFMHDNRKLFINKSIEQNTLYNNAIIFVLKNDEKNN